MNIRQIMQSGLVTIGIAESLQDALEKMVVNRVRHLLVIEGGALAGVVTDRDLRFALPSRIQEIEPARRAEFMRTTSVSAVCIRFPYVVSPDADVRDAATEMRKRRIGCLPVVEGRDLVGMVTTTDLLDALIELAGPANAESGLGLRTASGEIVRPLLVTAVDPPDRE